VRIHRIRLKNFRGVIESEARFAPQGVTIVEGPNEVGKSTLLRALDLLLDYRDDSKSDDVRAAKPVDRDVGAEVEADLEIGTYNLTYFKRFHRDRETRLTIRAPTPESLTGREAHDRVQQILDGSLDTALWKALRIEQGEKVGLPDLKGQPALAKALDHAAGEVRAGDREEALFDATRTEYGKYWTDKGKEKEDPLGRSRSEATKALETTQGLGQKLVSLDEDIVRSARLDREAADAKASIGQLERSVTESETAWGEISKLREELERTRAEHQTALTALGAAKNAETERHVLATSATDATARTSALAAAADASQPAREGAGRDFTSAREAREVAKNAAEIAEREETLRRKDRDFRREELELAQMEERLTRIQNSEKGAAEATEVLTRLSITEELRATIRDADIEVKKARARLEAASPQLHVRALRDVQVVLDGMAVNLSGGEERSLPLPEAVTVQLADVVEMQVSPGMSDATLRERCDAAEQALLSACEQAGVKSAEEAETAWVMRQKAEQAVAQRDQIVAENLRDLARGDLERRIKSTRSRLESYLMLRPTEPPLPYHLDEAKRLLAIAERGSEDAKARHRAADDTFEAARQVHEKLREEQAVNAALLKQAQEDLGRISARLAEERERSSDEALVKRRQAAELTEREKAGAFASADRLLSAADPTGSEERLSTAREALKKAGKRCETIELELRQLRGRLDTLGEQGLAESLAEAERASFEAEDTLARLLRRAAAAKLLYETLASERDTARRAYVAPLQEGVRRLGRHVFGPTFSVEVDDELRIASRTLEDITIPFASLSTGAREQLGVLVRLAAALVVAKDGGAPLVLDDALGSTDPDRLEAVGTVLSLAGRECQVIVLTCSPERYAHVAAASRVRIEAIRPT
jgi:energy-coupling factor transporter ATP-binding protein EcfA2